MKNVLLVTTDFSINSKAGIRFAIQLAAQHSMHLVFVHVIELLIPTRWNDEKVETYMSDEINDTQEKIKTFVTNVYKESNLRPGKFECVVRYGSPVDNAIVEYAVERKASFICISTRGAGTIQRIIGTYTSYIIKHSPIPVFIVPKNYKRTPIVDIIYSSDLTDVKGELEKVKKFASMVKAKVTVLHYDYFIQLKETKSDFEKIQHRYSSPKVKFALQRFDLENTLALHLKKAIRKFKPSLITLFTNQDRNWYERIFLASKSADVSYDTKKPILVFPKAKAE